MTSYKLIIASLLFYLAFAFRIELKPFEGVLFANDFSEVDVFEWLVHSCLCYSFLIFIGVVAFNRVEKVEDKLIFVALIVDSIISIFSYIVFGYHQHNYLKLFTNSIPLGIIIYSQFYGRIH